MTLRVFIVRLVMPAALVFTAGIGGGWKWENFIP